MYFMSLLKDNHHPHPGHEYDTSKKDAFSKPGSNVPSAIVDVQKDHKPAMTRSYCQQQLTKVHLPLCTKH